MKIALLGANANFAFYVAKHINFKGFGRRRKGLVDRVIDYTYDDLKRHLDGFDVVISLVGSYKGDRSSIWESNVKVNERIVDALRSNQKFIYISSIAVYGKSAWNVDERSPLHPDTIYAQAKAKTEEIVREKHRNSVILRLGTLYGGKYNVYCKMLKMLKRGFGLVFGNGKNYVPFTYANDAALTVKNSLDKKGIFVVSARSVKLREVYEIAKNLVNPKAKLLFIPKPLLNIIVTINKLISLGEIFNEEYFYSLTSNRMFISRKAEKYLNFRETPIKEGIKKTWEECVELYAR